MGTRTVQAVTDIPESVAAPKEESRVDLIDPQKGKFKGKVKWFNNAKGYGFIIADPIPTNLNNSSNNDMFAHFSSINMKGYKSLKSGQIVLFDTKRVENGIHAVNISTFENADE
jgi:CspA family cold shock protein